jgi:hypothetical protein
MSTNLTLIETKTVGAGGAANITFTSIPLTYTDLKVVYSLRQTDASDDFRLYFNGNAGTSLYSYKEIYTNNGTSANSFGRSSFSWIDNVSNDTTSMTANTFNNGEIYITNYASTTQNKSLSIDVAAENNAASTNMALVGGLYASNNQITSITLATATGYAQYSTASIYGVSNVTSTPKATGGMVSQDNTYYYHTFVTSGVFTPTVALSADILVVAGGGGGGMGQYANTPAGGGGAGGLLGFTSQSLTTTGYSVTVGAGGTKGIWNSSSGGSAATNGGNSQFAALTAAVGGGRGAGWSDNNTPFPANTGGSGGGGYGQFSGTGAAGTSGQGNAGGSSSFSGSGYTSGGGGGAGAAGGSATSTTVSGAGGVGSSTYSSWGLATFTGEIINGTVYFAGGGGVSGASGGVPSSGGYGGGGAGAMPSPTSVAYSGLANTGGGGGSGLGQNYAIAGNGGSGVIIVRYAK